MGKFCNGQNKWFNLKLFIQLHELKIDCKHKPYLSAKLMIDVTMFAQFSSFFRSPSLSRTAPYSVKTKYPTKSGIFANETISFCVEKHFICEIIKQNSITMFISLRLTHSVTAVCYSVSSRFIRPTEYEIT